MNGSSHPDRWKFRAAVAVAGLVLLAVNGVLLLRMNFDGSSARASSSSGPTPSSSSGSKPTADGVDGGRSPVRQPPAATPRFGSYVETRVNANGDLRVTQWVRSARPLSGIDLLVPTLLDGSPRATDLLVAADQVVLDVPRTVGMSGRHVSFDAPTRVVHLRYTLRGVVERSFSVRGRALARTVALNVRYAGSRGSSRVVFVGDNVLSLACAAPFPQFAKIRPCGTPTAGGWSVLLRGAHRSDLVVAQLDLS